MLKTDIVLFGEALPQDVLLAATFCAFNCDLLIFIGSTLAVYPAAYIPVYSVQAVARLVVLNLTSTSMDD